MNLRFWCHTKTWKRQAEIFIPDAHFVGLTDLERDELIERAYQLWLSGQLEMGWEVVHAEHDCPSCAKLQSM